MTELASGQVTTAITSLAITGAVVSVITQYTKKWLAKKASKQAWVVLLSLGAAGILYLLNLVPAEWWQLTVGVWTMANTVYFIIMGWFNKQA